MMKVDYFVFYYYVTNIGAGRGNTCVTVNSPINSIDDIRAIEKRIAEERGYASCVLVNYQPITIIELKGNHDNN